MKTKIIKIVTGMLFVCMAVFLSGFQAMADNGNVAVSSVSGKKGEKVTATVTVSSDVAAMADIWIAYDTNLLEFVDDGSHGGTAGFVQTILTDLQPNQPMNFELSFLLKEVGNTTLVVAQNTNISDINVDPENAKINISTSNGSVTVNASDAASSDSHISGLIVSAISENGASQHLGYSPAFSTETYEYTATVPYNVTRIVVSTTLSDAKAKTQVSGTKLEVGDNKTTILVTAEDGSQSTYTLYTKREPLIPPTTKGEEQPPEQTTQPSEQPADQQETTTQMETQVDRTPKFIDSIGKYIIQDFSLVTKPEGYEEGISTFKNQNIAVLKGIGRNITLICLADDPQGTNANFCLYNEASNAIDKMFIIRTGQKEYTLMPTDDNYEGPKGYTKTMMDLNGQQVKAWIREAGAEFYVVYAMNWQGDTALYIYDTKEQTMQRYVEGNKSVQMDEEPKAENTEYLAMKRQYDTLSEEYETTKQSKNKMIRVMTIAIVLLAVIAAASIYFFLAEKEKNATDPRVIRTSLPRKPEEIQEKRTVNLQKKEEQPENQTVMPQKKEEQVENKTVIPAIEEQQEVMEAGQKPENSHDIGFDDFSNWF